VTKSKWQEAAVRAWLIRYAWADDTLEAKQARVACIMAQDDWRYIDALADKYAGQAEVPGPEAFSEAEGFALSALYECHDGPHLETCPSLAWERQFESQPDPQ
jgi:hypothetical protein